MSRHAEGPTALPTTDAYAAEAPSAPAPAMQPASAGPPPSGLATLNRFTLVVLGYIAVCLAGIAIIVIRGDGPHPRVASIYPFNGDRYFPGGGAQITFSQAMNGASVERALQVSPGAQGQGAWFGNTLNIQPVGDWSPDVTYHVRLTGQVTDTEGRPLHTPFSFWFRVHHVGRLTLCRPAGHPRTVCERTPSGDRPLFLSPQPVAQFALSPDGSQLLYTRPDGSGLPHVFLIQVDGTGNTQLTFGRRYADSAPMWTQGDASNVDYLRRSVVWRTGPPHLGRAREWSVGTDGSNNGPL